MAGMLAIHSTGNGELLDGHSWIEYRAANGDVTTYGTWGNNPRGLGNGLHENLESGRVGIAWRSIYLDDEREARLFAKIQEYAGRGEEAWSILHPCSAFAAAAWHAATGERLRHRRYFLFSNPSTLRDALIKS